MKKSIVLLVCVTYIIAGTVLSFAEQPGTRTGAFLKINPGPRPAGMGEAYVAVADDVHTVHWNPAGLGFLENPEVQFMHALWLGHIQYEHLAFTQPILKGSIGTTVSLLHMQNIRRIREGTPAGSFRVYDFALDMGYGFPVLSWLPLGFNLRGIQSKIDQQISSCMSSDVGMLVTSPHRRWSFGISGQNLGTRLNFIDKNERLPEVIRTGIAYRERIEEEFVQLILTAEAEKPADGDYKFGVGLEHLLLDTLALRAGYRYDLDEQGLDKLARLRIGMGIYVGGMRLDYAWAPYASMGYTHRFSLGYLFGQKVRQPYSDILLSANPFIISPTGDGINDITDINIDGQRLEAVKRWTLTITDTRNNTVRTYTGKNLPATIPWNGLNEQGILVHDGRYLCKLRATEYSGAEIVKHESILIDTMPPRLSVSVSTTTISLGPEGIVEPIVFYTTAQESNRITTWKFDITNARNKQVKTFTGENNPPSLLAWNGMDDYYGALIPAGTYWAVLSAYDIAGNQGISTPVSFTAVQTVPQPVREVELVETTKGLQITLTSQVLFGVGQSALREEAYRALDEVVDILRQYPDNNVVIEGHTDSVGAESTNQKLSEARAWTVYEHLLKKGGESIKPGRIKTVGYGKSRPIASNATRQGRATNRRVEIIILRSEDASSSGAILRSGE